MIQQLTALRGSTVRSAAIASAAAMSVVIAGLVGSEAVVQAAAAAPGAVEGAASGDAASVSDASGGAVRYVDDDAPAGGDGLSWLTAYDTIQDGIDEYDSSGGMIGEIWTAAGTYRPTFRSDPGDPRSATFFLRNNLAILGGFAGTETMSSQRDPDVNISIISGDVGVQGDSSDNCWHIIRSVSGHNSTAVLDGFVIRDGNANGSEDRGAAVWNDGNARYVNCHFTNNYSQFQGGAVYNNGGPMFEFCRFTDNTVGAGPGGAVFSKSATAKFIACDFVGNMANGGGAISTQAAISVMDCTFEANMGGGSGGAIGSSAFVDIRNCEFQGNSAQVGGALSVNHVNLWILNSRFIGNSATVNGGALRILNADGSVHVTNCEFNGNIAQGDGGGVHLASSGGQYVNCTFTGNTAAKGGGMWFEGDPISLRNCTFANNSASTAAGGLWIESAALATIVNSVFWGNAGGGIQDQVAQVGGFAPLSIDYSCVMGWTGSLGGAGNLGSDPAFVDALGPDLAAGTDDDDVRIFGGSPCIDAGDNSGVGVDSFDLDGDTNTAEAVPEDGFGGVRFFDDPDTADTGDGVAPIVDLGAHEFDGTTMPPPPPAGTYVGPSGGSWFVAANWAGGQMPDASTDVQISTTVLVDQAGAAADSVLIHSGGSLEIGAGDLTANMLTIESGGGLVMDDANGLLNVSTLIALGTGSVQWNAGTIALAGQWTSPTGISLGCAGTAALQLGASATVTTPTITVCPAGSVTGSGLVVADVANDGTIGPGASPGIITIDGDFAQGASGTLIIEMTGYLPGFGHDRLDVSGTATLGGTLEIALLPGFQPELAGDQRIVVATTVQGTFATTNVPMLPGSFVFALNQDVPVLPLAQEHVQLLTTLSGTGTRLYVDAASAAGGDGQSWVSATDDLQDALQFAALNPGAVTEIWVAAGTYKPDRSTGDRSMRFLLPPDFELYGGFAGTETTVEERNIAANPSVLNGDLLGNDGPGFSNRTDNSRTVVSIEPNCGACITTPRLDGFTIQGGYDDSPGGQAGGMFCEASDAVLVNLIIRDNYAVGRGGGAWISGDNVTVQNCQFLDNDGGSWGSALVVAGFEDMPFFDSCVFDGNSGGLNGTTHILNNASPTFENCQWTNNAAVAVRWRVESIEGGTATFSGCLMQANEGGIQASGGLCTVIGQTCDFVGNTGSALSGGSVSMTGCLFQDNSAERGAARIGGGIFEQCQFVGNAATADGGAVHNDSATSQFVECAFENNSAGGLGGAIWNWFGGDVTIDNCSFAGNTAAVGGDIHNTFGDIRGVTGPLGPGDVYNAGNLSPGLNSAGQEIGAFVVTGQYQQVNTVLPRFNATNLVVDLAGATPGVTHDVLEAGGGAVHLEGGLLVNLVGGFEPVLGQMFKVVNSMTLDGQFGVARTPNLAAARYLEVLIDPDGVTLTIQSLAALISFDLTAGPNVTATPGDAALEDMDGDGDLDVVLAVPHPTMPTSAGTLAIYRNNGVDGDGQWLGLAEPPVSIGVGVDPRALAVGHFNADSFPDVAVANFASDDVMVFMNNALGDATLALSQTLPVAQEPTTIAAGRCTSAAVEDLVVGGNGFLEVRHLTNDGTGSFSAGQAFTDNQNGFPEAVLLADVDGDADDDLIIARGVFTSAQSPPWSRIDVHSYDSLGQTFGPRQSANTGAGVRRIAFVDIDGDGSNDLLTCNAQDGTCTILLNDADGTGGLSFVADLTIGDTPVDLAVADFDGDLDDDVAVVVELNGGGRALRVARNDTNAGTQLVFATTTDVGAGGDPLLVVAGDLDQDLLIDLLSVSESAELDKQHSGVTAPTLSALLSSSDVDPCPADSNGDSMVNVNDLLNLLAAWGPCPAPCAADTNDDGQVNVTDLLALLAAWGTCP